MRTAHFLALLACVPVAVATAQDSLLVTVGDRVRVTAPTLDIDKYTGTLGAMDSDTLIVDGLRVALTSVTRLDIHRGTKSNAGKGAVVGGDLSRPYLWVFVIGGLILSASALAIALGFVER